MPSSFDHLRAKPRAAYVHIPFCLSKCFYCDFSSFPGMEHLFENYVRAIVREIDRAPVGFQCGRPLALDKVYFGGGTPSILSPALLIDILDSLRERLGISEHAEITLEANPGTVDEHKFAQLYAAGFNRLSIGVQSFDDELLARIGRVHTSAQAIQAYNAARLAGFANVGIDLIFALPGQSLINWRNALQAAIELAPEHVSLYELSIEEGTRFQELCSQGLLNLPSEDERLEMYEAAIFELTKNGYEHYEVSNFARPGYRSRHNQVYWRNELYYGFGAGATSFITGVRARRVADPRKYIVAIDSGSDAVEYFEQLTGRRLLSESIVLGLRMLDGVDMHKFSTESGSNLLVEFADEIQCLKARGLVEIANDHLRVTRQGLMLLNDVAVELTSA